MQVTNLLYDSDRAYVTLGIDNEELEKAGSFITKLLRSKKRILDMEFSKDQDKIFFSVDVNDKTEKNKLVNELQMLVNSQTITSRQSVAMPLPTEKASPSENAEVLIKTSVEEKPDIPKEPKPAVNLKGFPKKLLYNDQIIEWFKKINESDLSKEEKAPYMNCLKEAIREKMGTHPNIGVMVAFSEIYGQTYANWMKRDGVTPDLRKDSIRRYFQEMPGAKLIAYYQKIINNLA